MSVTATRILTGEDDLSEWTDEELERGQRKDKTGKWQGRKPNMVPRALHDELVKRRMSQAYDLLRENTHKAVAVLVTVMTDADADYGVRVKAAELILDRTLGKAPQHVDITGLIELAPWQQAMAQGIVGTDEQAATFKPPALPATGTKRPLYDTDEEDDIVDGEIVEDEPEPIEIEIDGVLYPPDWQGWAEPPDRHLDARVTQRRAKASRA